MTTNTFLANLRRHLSPANKALLDAMADSDVVAGLLEKSEAIALQEREAQHKELTALPTRFAKKLSALGAAHTAAQLIELKAAEALLEARAARHSTFCALNGAAMQLSREENALREALLKTAPTLIVAASRAVEALSVSNYEPQAAFHIGQRRDAYSDPATRWENDEADAKAHAENRIVAQQHLNALQAAATARKTLREMMLEPLSEAQAAEKVSLVLGGLNVALAHLKGKPQVLIDEHMDVRVRAGLEEKVLVVKTAEVTTATLEEQS